MQLLRTQGKNQLLVAATDLNVSLIAETNEIGANSIACLRYWTPAKREYMARR